MTNAAQAYADVGVQSDARSASPHQLITMLFEGCRKSLLQAKYAIESNNLPVKSSSIAKALDIINTGLRSSLDREKGGSLAQDLDDLYRYMGRRLTHANRHSDAGAVDEVLGLISDIANAWKSIKNQAG